MAKKDGIKASNFLLSVIYRVLTMEHLRHNLADVRSSLTGTLRSAFQPFGGGLQPNPYSRYTINYFLLPNFIIHVVGLACLWALWYYLRFTTVFPYHHRVFYCRDVLLYKPNFRPEDFEVYVSYTLLYILAFCVPIIVRVQSTFDHSPAFPIYKRVFIWCSSHTNFCGHNQTTYWISTAILSISLQRLFTSMHSPFGTLSSPSPHLACLYKNADELRYALLTFPSLHAAFSSYSACFASCYIYYMINLRGAPLLRPMLIFGLLGMALPFFCAILCSASKKSTIFFGSHDNDRASRRERSPFFSWFRLPRVHAPSVKEEYVVYEEEVPMATTPAGTRHRRNQDRTYEVTTTTESFHRTIQPPNGSGTQQGNPMDTKLTNITIFYD
uniref:Uncharacterized protein n=1 Tax=Ditylenchus dipsaci TaxID=166011 RepID=A0A915EU03_9BILA